MKIISLLAAFIFLISSCNNSGTGNKPKQAKTHVDSLWEEVMAGHDEAMSKMGKITRAKKTIQQAIDSIGKLPQNLQKAALPYKARLDSLLDRLKYADYAMNRWMEEFDTDSALDDAKKRVEYLESEKLKISKVKQAMINGLEKADSLLKRKF